MLALDTSSVALSVALLWGGEAEPETVLSNGQHQLRARTGPMSQEHTELAGNLHGERLAPMIDELMGELDAVPKDLGAIAVGLGPGPFTGLRVGVVTAGAMGDALGVPTYGICSLDAIAWACPSDGNDLVVATDARRKQVYWRRYDAERVPTTDPDIAIPQELARSLHGRVMRVAGAGAHLYAETFGAFDLISYPPDPDATKYPSAAGIGRLVYERALAGEPPDELTPLYLRRPDAKVPGKPKAVTPR
jgi:tRNA threonylcarbamoyl adenosine modification protein YeaZ